ncbi:MAG: hypothetical protein K5981_04240 [Clostridia bacterium]|nr:hypothetical protein [Clostridia bacterium]
MRVRRDGIDEPYIGAVSPAANAQTLDEKQPEICAEIGNAGEGAVFTMTLNGEEVEAAFADGKLSYKAAEAMEDGRYTIAVSVERADGKTAEKSWSFYVGKTAYQLFFGQLHSHTTYSDGSGTLEGALDKGWHLAPTNNQDNHKGRWGNANDARDVIITNDFSEAGIYDAIRNYRVYATEDKNLEIGYTVNGEQMGTIFTEVPETLNVSVSVYDPDKTDSIAKVELVANSGAVAYTWDDADAIAEGLLEAELEPTYTYYFARVTEEDGDLAVTAPVWVGESLKLGISAVECGTSSPVTGEAFTLSTTLYNSEKAEAAIKSVTYTTNGSVVLGSDSEAGSIPASGTKAVEFSYQRVRLRQGYRLLRLHLRAGRYGRHLLLPRLG